MRKCFFLADKKKYFLKHIVLSNVTRKGFLAKEAFMYRNEMTALSSLLNLIPNTKPDLKHSGRTQKPREAYQTARSLLIERFKQSIRS